VFIELQPEVTQTNYQTSVVLTAGATYRFKVKARNSVGFSAYSADISILAAK